jgi:hypothetical protein
VHDRIVGPLYRRVSFPIAAVVAVGFLANAVRSDPNGTSPTNLALISVLAVWLAAFSVRGWRSATLLADAQKVTVRQLARTVSWPWEQIGGFTAETRPAPMMWLPVLRPQRRVLGVRMRHGQVRWLYELSCKPRADGRSWVDDSAQRLNALAQLAVPSAGA